MSEDKISAKLEQLSGSVKEGFGKLTGDKEIEVEGIVEKGIQDRQNNLIEQAYNEVCLGERNLTWQQWIDGINAVSIDDVVKVGKVIRLQAIYFMEGVAQ